MSKHIAFSDIQVGDKIEITDVQVIDIEDREDRWLNGNTPETLHGWERTFKLIERPLPPLPTEPGSVIEVTNANPFEDNHQQVTRWFLRESHSYPKGMWQGTTYNSAISFQEMQKFVELHGGFEVLL